MKNFSKEMLLDNVKFLVALGAFFMLISCEIDNKHTQREPESQPILRMGNPASEFCVQRGGRVEIRKYEEGEAGVCIFPDGREVDEWDYFYFNLSQPESEQAK